MSDQPSPTTRRGRDDFDKKFTPTGTMLLMALFIVITALAWASIYFGDLLAKR